MLNTLVKILPITPRVSLKPFQKLLKMDQKHRQRQSLQNLDARTLADIGMSEARRDAELRNLKAWS